MSVDISSFYRPAAGWQSGPAMDDAWTSAELPRQSAGGGAVQFATPGAGSSVNFGAPLTDALPTSTDGQPNPGDPLSQLIGALLSQVMAELARRMQGQNGSGQETAPQNTDTAAPSGGAMPLNETNAAKPTAHAASAADGPSAGSGPRTFNITNTQDHDINIGQFDQHNQLVGEITLKPGESGQMRYQNDFTGLLKQADADGNYRDDASRLEFYNGFVNTSDIDGRNAAIHATDHQGFEIGDRQSIADRAPADIVSTDSAGNKTIAGYYDGSSETMRKGGQFMTDMLGTGMTYMHPDDDRLPEGQNPMRHTDAMTLDVTFGKA
ncbi:hypothetical protein HF675_03385 [Serratia sp. JUb9]|uniref:hypothetical protein n=1 Tax=Serratia sp. JUb9 TaxID=2724469 RepID=UPI00164EBE6E|nr:hypothetical protein [Serratia sp. JUb9]MCA4825067.1 hypothetical protein [Serratia rubidaea]QNK33122.1 hypothetical protein HF675_03385 [Serratia sp. JUb9]QPT13409.1 hypothetical protein I6G37_23705 [Serratia rubidaea]